MITSYAIRHVTRFAYDAAVSESVMELRMRPSSEGGQRCLQFDLQLQPRAGVFAYRDCLGNWVHHFDIPRRHTQLSITGRSQVQMESPPCLPEALSVDAWALVNEWTDRGEDWDFRQPSRFVAWTDQLIGFAESVGPATPRARDPLTTVCETMGAIHQRFEYAPNTTRVDSPIDEVLAARRGVCQDFTHVMLAMLRRLDLPCRYVSGYIAPDASDEGRGSPTIATHAWVEVLLPELGWIGVDPTNNIHAGTRHIRVAVGRDYADVPPTRGVYKGGAASSLAVSVEIVPAGVAPTLDPAVLEASWVSDAAPMADEGRERQHEQQQQ